MPRGPKRKPAELERRLGNPSKRRKSALAAAAADAAPSDLPPPPHLAPGVADVWRGYVATTIGQTIIKAGDLFALERLCTYLYEWRQLTEALRDNRTKSGLRLTESYKRAGYGTIVKTRPEVGQRAHLEQAIRGLEAQFGGTPSSRATVMEKIMEAREAKKPPLPAPPGSQGATDGAAPNVPPPPSSPIGTLGSRKLN